MADSVIDALYVTLGLKSDGFSQGIQTATQSLTGFAMKVAGLALGFEGLQAGIHYFEGLHQKLSDLYFTSRNLGVMGTELSRLGELAQMFGGRIEDATGSVQGLQSAVFNLRFKGQMSESLAMLQRFGVSYLNGNGTMRDPEAIARDAAVAIERQARTANLTPADRYQMAMSFGLQGGLASAAAQGPAGFDEQLARARKDQSGLSEGTLRGQSGLERNIISRRAQRDVEMSGVLAALLPDIEKLNEILEDLTRRATPMMVKGIDALNDLFFKKPPPWLEKLEGNLKDLSVMLGPAGSLIVAIGGLTAAMALGSTATSLLARVSLVAARATVPLALGLGLGVLIDQLDEKLGSHTVNAVGKWDMFAPSEWQNYDPNNNPIARGKIVRPPAVVPPSAPATPNALRPSLGSDGKPAASTGGPGTSITFENVNVYGRGHDGATLARDFESRIQRGYLVSNSDPGMVS